MKIRILSAIVMIAIFVPLLIIGELPFALFMAVLSMCGRNRHIGTFNTLEEAFNAYKKSKEQYIKSMANKWRNEINDNVYNAMIVYDVKIND